MTVQKSKGKGIGHMVSIIGILAGLLIVIITAHNLFPPIMFRSIVVVLVLLIVVVNGYGVFGEPFIRLSKKMIMARRHHFLAKKYFKEFGRFADRFGELIRIDYCDTIPHVLKDLQSNSNDKRFRQILASTDDFENAFGVFSNAMGTLPINKENLSLLIKWFESIMNLCNEHLIYKPVKQIKEIGSEGIVVNIKSNYTDCRNAYNKFILEYMDFAKEMNKHFDEKIAREYFRKPEEL